MRDFIDHLARQATKLPVKKTDAKEQKKGTSAINQNNVQQQSSKKLQTEGNKSMYGYMSKYAINQNVKKTQEKGNTAQKIETPNKLSHKIQQKAVILQTIEKKSFSNQQSVQATTQHNNINNRPKYGRQQNQLEKLKQQEKPNNSQTTPQKSHFNRKPAHNVVRNQILHQQSHSVQQKVVNTKVVQTITVQPVLMIEGGDKKTVNLANSYQKSEKKLLITPNNSQIESHDSSMSNKSTSNFNRNGNQTSSNSSRQLKPSLQSAIKVSQQAPKVRSNAIIFCIRKLYNKNMQTAYKQLWVNSKNANRKANILAKLLVFSAIGISKIYSESIQRQFFKIAKAKLNKSLNDQSKTQSKVQNVIVTKSRQLLCNLVESKFKIALRNSFASLKLMTHKRQFIIKGISTLSLLETRKMRQYFQTIKNNIKRQSIRRGTIINSLSVITNGYLTREKKNAFQRLITANLSMIKIQPKIKVKSKISQISQGKSLSSQNSINDFTPISQNRNIQQKDNSPSRSNDVFQPNQKTVQVLQSKIDESKGVFETQKKSLEEFLGDLRNLIRQNQQQVSILNQANRKLKAQNQKLITPNSQQQNQSFNDRKEGYLLKLVQMYTQIFKRSDHQTEMISLRNIIDKYELNIKSLEQDPCVLTWNTLKENSELKRRVESIEGVQRHRKTALILEEEHKVIENLVRSYVKERYLWEWMRQSINNSA